MRGRAASVAAVAVCLFAGGYLTVGATGRGSADTPTIVIDHSIGGVAIGMAKADVEALLGSPADSLPITLSGGGTGLLVHYRLHGGVLIVAYAGGRVVSVETSSSYYRTDAGIGPGTSKAGLHGFHTDFCSLGLWDGSAGLPLDGVVTVFQTAGDRIVDVTITQLAYYDLCDSAPADQEVPNPAGGRVQLSVEIDPDGAGSVQSTPYEIDCPTACTRLFEPGTTVTLTEQPTSGFTFTGWSGDCSGAGSCTLTLDDAKHVVAHFTGSYAAPPPTTSTTRTQPPPPTTTTSPTTTRAQ